ncbi:DinB family protein [Deinococcus roseus]|uniref:DinB-like domain-containing protein n=1 Tax=Deinococcus roseus TaxID=392414 RepID=A0ABQ2CVJ6_9DEIO|nr:DinB family protein [Deinococcus roseus]GGJ21306.1 hypothetical protein GCM10008938_04400 [Deinococcus roseus]
MDKQYPVGKLSIPDALSKELLDQYVQLFQGFSRDFHDLVCPLTEQDLHRQYREGSFTVRQLAFHIADAHDQGFNRFRFGLTLDVPTIQPFPQELWAALQDYNLPVDVAVHQFKAVNDRWLHLLKHVSMPELQREFIHPEEGKQAIWRLISKHEWHVRHHLEHIRLALKKD